MTTIDLHPDYLKKAIDMAIASLSRSQNSKLILNPGMQQLIEQDIALYRVGLNSIKTSTK